MNNNNTNTNNSDCNYAFRLRLKESEKRKIFKIVFRSQLNEAGNTPNYNQSEKCLKLNFFLKGHDLLKIVIVLFCILLAVQTLPPFPIFTEGRRGLYTGYILTVTDTVNPVNKDTEEPQKMCT